MPSVRMLLTPEIADQLDFEVQFDLSEAVRTEVSKTLGVDVAYVEVLWIPLDLGINCAPVMIDVMYSVRPDFNPSEDLRNTLAENLTNMTLQFEGMPAELEEVAAWILPQDNATFRVAKI